MIDPRPTIIIGAPRSGTNMLRDALTRLPGLVTWPCDEINPVWRHGNLEVPHDELTPDHARPEVRRAIRRRFERLRRRAGGDVVVVEKTCANSLRVPFVDAVLPEARFVFIVRDGRDAIASTMRRWQAPFELGYTARKLRFVPLVDLPHHVRVAVGNRLHRRTGGQGRVASWGPRFDGIDTMLREASLLEVCARQWAACVTSATRALDTVASERVHRVGYERLVADPAGELSRVLSFLGRGEVDVAPAAAGITDRYIGSWRRELDDGQAAFVDDHVAQVEAALGPVV